MSHPRLRLHPQHRHYVELANEFRPFVMFTHTPYYRSDAVNTDALGLREQYDHEGRFFDYHGHEGRYEACNVLVGGSTVFGVDATSDETTISARLQRPRVPCLNLGIRGAVSHQELQAFLVLRRMMPKVRNVVLFSGVNLVSTASLADTMLYPEFGAVFSEPHHYDVFCDHYRKMTMSHRQLVRRNALERFDRWIADSWWGQRLARWLWTGRQPRTPHRPQPERDFETKLELLEDHFANDLDTWAAVGAGSGTQIHFVLQPVAQWCGKPLSHAERTCIKADCKAVPSIRTYANREFYEQYAPRVRALCESRGIPFHDANEWIREATGRRDVIFTDPCHLTDAGNELVAERLRNQIAWREKDDATRAHRAA